MWCFVSSVDAELDGKCDHSSPHHLTHTPSSADHSKFSHLKVNCVFEDDLGICVTLFDDRLYFEIRDIY